MNKKIYYVCTVDNFDVFVRYLQDGGRSISLAGKNI